MEDEEMSKNTEIETKSKSAERVEYVFPEYLTMPYYIYRSRKISDEAKKLCAAIFSLSGKTGYCFASNDYLKEMLHKNSVDTIKKGLQRLERDGYIERKATSKGRCIRLINPDIELEFEAQKKSLKSAKMNTKGVDTKSTPRGGHQVHPRVDTKSTSLTLLNYILKYSVQIKNFEHKSVQDLSKMNTQKIKEIAFNIFWKFYPRKEQKGRAEKYFLKLNFEDIEDILKIAFFIPGRFADVEKKYIPLPSSFLNAKQWLDDYFEGKDFNAVENSQKEGESLQDEKIEVAVEVFKAFLYGYGDDVSDEEIKVLNSFGWSVEKVKEFISDNGKIGEFRAELEGAK